MTDPDSGEPEDYDHRDEPSVARRLNVLRAAVLGANDGIVSLAALVVGVAAATTESATIATAGFAGLAAGALSMAVGEYVSVYSQRDAEESQLEREKRWHEKRPEWELEQLVRLNMGTGMSEKVARLAAKEQTAHDPVGVHARMHLGIDPDELTSPVQAGISSLLAFAVGGAIPVITVLVMGVDLRIPATFAAALVALALTGAMSARIARSPYPRAIIRNVMGGTIAMAITYGIGLLVGQAV